MLELDHLDGYPVQREWQDLFSGASAIAQNFTVSPHWVMIP
jgi:hypothetical protein